MKRCEPVYYCDQELSTGVESSCCDGVHNTPVPCLGSLLHMVLNLANCASNLGACLPVGMDYSAEWNGVGRAGAGWGWGGAGWTID